MDSIYHVQAEDHAGNSSFSRYYSSSDWATRKVYQLRRDRRIASVGIRVLRGEWEEIDV